MASVELLHSTNAPACVNTGGATPESEVRMQRKPSVEERFWSYVSKGDLCWTWMGYVTPKGYGFFWDGRRHLFAYRFAYELLVGPVPSGSTLDHLCRNRVCVNPAHLEPVTNRENMMRGFGPSALNARKTRCPHGHEYTPENTGSYAGSRFCRECKRITNQRRNRLIREAKDSGLPRETICVKCGALLSPSNISGHCRPCSMRRVAKQRAERLRRRR